ncbi:MAG TPA: nitroreductase family deazaflavin-dependent oxidoreductase [Trebonia sp.]|nr:nitroreductase family deazaflavin-dependent oxidoreductase [Trebonia sp.]
MTDPNDWNQKIIAEFRANAGKVGAPFEGATMILVHHVGRKSGREFVSPLVYLPKDGDERSVYIFASKGGAPVDPEWYRNLTAAGQATVEIGTETFPVAVAEVQGEERDRVYAEQATRMPGFAEYATKTAGIRTIPVLELTRQ